MAHGVSCPGLLSHKPSKNSEDLNVPLATHSVDSSDSFRVDLLGTGLPYTAIRQVLKMCLRSKEKTLTEKEMCIRT